jgi:1-acyl-sn-glycerol-3-phosphate acyltransferase
VSASLLRFDPTEHAGRQGAAFAALKTAELALRTLADYHRHRVVGIEHIPTSGPALFVFNHSLATYDSFLLAVTVHDAVQRTLWGIADRLIFKLPGIGDVFRSIGFVEGTRAGSIEILERGELLGVVPGGMREGLGIRRDKYEVDWRGRTGFVRASMVAGAPIILGACPRSDDIFDVRDNAITRVVYDRWKVPVPLFRGLGLTPLPRPVQLTHFLSEPIPPPVTGPDVTDDDVLDHHAYVTQRMGELMRQALLEE